jgi:GTPase
MFVDEARVRVIAGTGGKGCVSFRREKFVPRGGPDGGDGGDGGDIRILVDGGLRTLLHLRHTPTFAAQHGRHGLGKQCSGRRGSDCLVRVPPGTIIKDSRTGAWVADLVEVGDSILVARGGKGGKGNVHFKSATRRSPRISTPGGIGEEKELLLELQLLADVGLVGLPNVGKSTLLARLSNARPKIGNFPFTTLQPSLGIVAIGATDSLVMADIPGLVEGAHQGRGLGVQFLRHIERTRLLLFLVDSLSEDPDADFRLLLAELAAFSAPLARRPRIVAFSRGDLREPGWIPPVIDGEETLVISSQSGLGIQGLLHRLRDAVWAVPEEAASTERTIDAIAHDDLPFAWRVDRGLDLGKHPWPQRWIVGPVSGEAGEASVG